ncbi:MAG: FMN-binding protein [Actinomycetota bacterium]|nr:FMN-binding protein [Actinomycetota bacterium]
MFRYVLSLGLRLTLVCLVAAIGLGLTYSAVESRIVEMELEERGKAGKEVLAPLDAKPQEIDEGELAALQEKFPELVSVFEGIDENGNLVGYAIVVKGKGYSFFTMAVGVDMEGKVSGIEVVQHEETPGLGGSVVENSEFLYQFIDGGPEDFVLGEGIDAKTGATMTSRGLTDGVNYTLEIWRDITLKGGQ